MTYYIMRVERIPVPKGRPKFTKSGRAYTPKETADYEKEIAAAWIEQQGDTKLEGELEVRILFGVKNMRQDVDNLAKSVLDGLNGIAYKDDSQIVQLIAEKYPVPSEQAAIVVLLRLSDTEFRQKLIDNWFGG